MYDVIEGINGKMHTFFIHLLLKSSICSLTLKPKTFLATHWQDGHYSLEYINQQITRLELEFMEKNNELSTILSLPCLARM